MENKKQYQYIWNVIYEMFQKGEDINKIKYVLSKQISPYMEINDKDINYFDEEMEIEINPFLRFNKILSNIIDINIKKDYEEVRKIVFNVMVHILAKLDLYEGMNKKIIINRKIVKDLEEGKYGVEIKNLIKKFDKIEKINIANTINDMYKHSNGMYAFEEIIKKIYPDSIIYNNKVSEDKLVIYINSQKNEKNRKKFRLLSKLFLPMGLRTKVYWEHHFGVIGIEETMTIESSSIF